MKRVTEKDYTKEYYALHIKRYKKQDSWAKQRIADVFSFLKPTNEDIILDVGCGMGTFSLECAKIGSKVYAIDQSKEALDIVISLAKKYKLEKNITILLSKVDSIKLPSHKATKILCADILEHLYPEELTPLFRECKRLLQNKGELIIYTPNPIYKKGLMHAINLLRSMTKKKTEIGKEEYNQKEQCLIQKENKKYEYVHVDLKSPSQIKHALKSVGFKIKNENYTRTEAGEFFEKIPIIRKLLGGHALISAQKISD